MMSQIDLFFEEPLFDYELEKKRFIDHMDFLKNMSVEEHTFYKKWYELKSYRDFMSRSEEVKAKIWRPVDIFDKEKTVSEIEQIKPRIFFVDTSDTQYMIDWQMLRLFCHTMSYDQPPGRFLRFLIIDDVSGKYLGAVSIGNDVMAMAGRDTYIGWTQEARNNGILIHSAIGNCIMPTQPFGFNFLGGKLMACLILSKHVREMWKNVVGKTLVGMTTTSLYGPNSMYCGIPYWEGCGCSSGKTSIKPDDIIYDQWHEYVRKNRRDEYIRKTTPNDHTVGPVTGLKQRILDIIFREVGVSQTKYNHGYERGTYYSCFYENSREFLSGKITDESLLIPRKKMESDTVGMISWWKKKAIHRYVKLHEENRLKPEILFYNKMVDMSYEKAKSVYFNEVGR